DRFLIIWNYRRKIIDVLGDFFQIMKVVFLVHADCFKKQTDFLGYVVEVVSIAKTQGSDGLPLADAAEMELQLMHRSGNLMGHENKNHEDQRDKNELDDSQKVEQIVLRIFHIGAEVRITRDKLR